MAIYTMSDIHGMYGPFMRRIKQLDNLSSIKAGKDKLILLGDYIDIGNNSYKVLKAIYELQMDVGAENMIVLLGNHDKWFLDFLSGKNDFWINDPTSVMTLETFITEDEADTLRIILDKAQSDEKSFHKASEYTKDCLVRHHKDLLKWYRELPLFYRTSTQIFVHAGVDEEAEDWWDTGTTDEMFVGKYPPTTGRFYMDIIAGHVSTSNLTGNQDDHDIYYDGESHFFIDGIDSYPKSTSDNDRYIPLLVYDEKEGRGLYYSLLESGERLVL